MGARAAGQEGDVRVTNTVKATEPKNAFVIMPIRRPGTAEHEHFRAIYTDYLRPQLEAFGYVTERADDITKSGAISKDIIVRLAESDLVIAELTDLNPNVFYELGIRHALRSRGTIMILDEHRTPEIPFDLAAYRVHKYGTSSISAIGPLRRGLKARLEALESPSAGHDSSENPVHDWLPTLPSNVVRAANESTEGALREQLALSQRALRQFEQRFGPLDPNMEGKGPASRIQSVLERAREGRLSADLFRRAIEAASSSNRVGFLEEVHEIVADESNMLDSREYIRLVQAAEILGLTQIRPVIMEVVRSKYPNDVELHKVELAQLAHSHSAADREQARQGLAQFQGLLLDPKGNYSLGPNFAFEPKLLGVMLDAFHADNMHQQSLQLCEAIVRRFPSSDAATRNYARALSRVGGVDEDVVLRWYRRAALLPGASDISATWLANTLHNSGKNLESMEAFALACLRDPNDASNWCQLADEGCLIIGDMGLTFGPADSDIDSNQRLLPFIFMAAMRCSDFSQADLAVLQRAGERLGNPRYLEDVLQAGPSVDGAADPLLGLDPSLPRDRKSLAVHCYGLLRGVTTDERSIPEFDLAISNPIEDE